MPSERVKDALKIALALPVYQIVNLATYANTRKGWLAKIATFVVFLPIFAFTTVCWAAIWVIAVRLVLYLVN